MSTNIRKPRVRPKPLELALAYIWLVGAFCADYFSHAFEPYVLPVEVLSTLELLTLVVWLAIGLELAISWWSDELRATAKRALFLATALVLLFPVVFFGLRAGAMLIEGLQVTA